MCTDLWGRTGGQIDVQSDISQHGQMKIKAYCPQCRTASETELKSALSAGDTKRNTVYVCSYKICDRAVMDRQKDEAQMIMIEQTNVKHTRRYDLWAAQSYSS